MIVKPRIRGFICTTAHPVGCAKSVEEQIKYIDDKGVKGTGPKKVLVIGASTGYGLASRITAAFGYRASTIGVFFEKAAEGKRTATAGWYNTVAFEKAARAAGLYAQSFNGDAFSDEMKKQVVETIKKDLGEVDLVVYSLASPRRQHPKTGKLSKSTLRPIGRTYTNKSIDMSTGEIEEVTLPGATEEEIQQTVDVMGGEDWAMWIEALEKGGVLAPGVVSVAYSYVGPEVTNPVYRQGTIGAAKDHLEKTAKEIDQQLKAKGGCAFVSVNKALVTQSSSAIPFIPLYFILLMKVMKGKGVHEDCIHQIHRLFNDRLYSGQKVPVDEEGRIRIDDWEMREDVQVKVQEAWEEVNNENVKEVSDLEGYYRDFLKLFGFGFDDVDYEADVEIGLPLGGGQPAKK